MQGNCNPVKISTFTEYLFGILDILRKDQDASSSIVCVLNVGYLFTGQWELVVDDSNWTDLSDWSAFLVHFYIKSRSSVVKTRVVLLYVRNLPEYGGISYEVTCRVSFKGERFFIHPNFK